MVQDREWAAVERVVRAALDDADVLRTPPATDEELGFVTETITDHIVGAFVTRPREQ